MPTLTSKTEYCLSGTLVTALAVGAGKEIVVAVSGASIVLSSYYSCRSIWESVCQPVSRVYRSFSPIKCIAISTVGGTVIGIVGGGPVAGAITGFGICTGFSVITKVVGSAKKILYA